MSGSAEAGSGPRGRREHRRQQDGSVERAAPLGQKPQQQVGAHRMGDGDMGTGGAAAPVGDEVLKIVDQRIETVQVADAASGSSRPEPPCPRQSKPSTRQPDRCQ